jgi:hypothetical protein
VSLTILFNGGGSDGTASVTGSAATSATGTVGVVVTAPVSGTGAAGAMGSVGTVVSTAPAGTAAATATGSVSATGDAGGAVSGSDVAAATAAIGAVVAAVASGSDGAAATGSGGGLVATGASGTDVAAATGAVTASGGAAGSGTDATTATGTATASGDGTVGVAGTDAATATGAAAGIVDAPTSGAAAATATGAVAAAGDASATASGTAAATATGTVTASGGGATVASPLADQGTLAYGGLPFGAAFGQGGAAYGLAMAAGIVLARVNGTATVSGTDATSATGTVVAHGGDATVVVTGRDLLVGIGPPQARLPLAPASSWSVDAATVDGPTFASVLPTDVPGLRFWYDASTGLFTDAGTTAAVTNGDLLYQVDDRSGLGNNALQTTSGSRPTLDTTGYNGSAAIRFQSGQNLVLPDVFNGATEGEIFWLIKIPSTTTQKGFCRFQTEAGNFASHYTWSDGVIYDATLTTGRHTVGALNGLSGGTPTSWHVYSIVSKAGLWSAYLDGVQIYTTSSNTFGSIAAPTIGLSQAGYAWDGWLRQVFGFGRVLTADERSDLTQTLLASESAAPNVRVTQLSAESLYTATNQARVTQLAAESLYSTAPKARVTEDLVDVVRQGVAAARVTEDVVDVIYRNPQARTTQVVVEALTKPTAAEARTTEVVVEALTAPTGAQARATDVVVEALTAPTGAQARATDVVVEVLATTRQQRRTVDATALLAKVRSAAVGADAVLHKAGLSVGCDVVLVGVGTHFTETGTQAVFGPAHAGSVTQTGVQDVFLNHLNLALTQTGAQDAYATRNDATATQTGVQVVWPFRKRPTRMQVQILGF